MWLFVLRRLFIFGAVNLSDFIVATFFLFVYHHRFCLLDTQRACGGTEGMFGLGIKNTTDRRELWRFFIPKPKEYPHRHTLSNGKQVKSLADWTMNRSHDSGTVN